MQNAIISFRYYRGKQTTLEVVGDNCLTVVVFCIAFPLACIVLLARGVLFSMKQLARLSFTCSVWIFLAAVVVLFVLVLIVQLAVASTG